MLTEDVVGGDTIVVNLREKVLNKLMRKSSLRSRDRFQFSPHNILKAPGFSFENAGAFETTR